MTSTPSESILPVPLHDALSTRYLNYALSTITSRSLPDVRDGLKPVHRRLLYAMRQLRLASTTPPKKSARVVGDVIGQYHPHGDASIYDALVRMAQDFAQRYPLVDGQGNFGNIDGDNAAAMRYTEARLTAVAETLLEGIDDDAVDFRETYDGEGREPVVLPAAFPNLLANGSQGIAVGMATSIPPHNVGEICDALQMLVKRPAATVDDLLTVVQGPDFPTGGELVESAAAIREAYATGRGAFRVRARWEIEKLPLGLYQIVVTEIPYQVQKSRLIEKLAEIVTAKKLSTLEDVRDESAEDIRIVLVPKSRNVEADMLMEQLFRLTELESRFSLNMNVLDAHNVPRVMGLKDVCRAFLDHRHEVLERRSRHRLAKIERRLEILGGYLIVFLDLDEVIRIIREEDEPKTALMARFSLTELQADAILDMRLRSLRKLEEMEIRREFDGLSAERDEIQALLADEGKRWKAISAEIAQIKKRFGPDTELGRRRTRIGEPPSAVVVSIEPQIEREPITVFLSEKGWIRALRGHGLDPAEIKYKDGDAEGFVLQAETTDKILLFGSDGRFYTLGADKLPRGRGFGEPVRMMVDLANDADIVALLAHVPGRKLVLASTDGRGFVVPESDVLAQTRAGKQVLNLNDGAKAAVCRPVAGDTVAVIGTHRRLLCFPLDELPEMSRGKGVMLQKYHGAQLSDLTTFKREEGLVWQMGGGRTRTEPGIPVMARGRTGNLPPRGFPQNNKFS
ncbi:DNA topoisomerase IV subunit A [Inquilinus sp. Marseille-Q2685]|uniref:DNA topoisomerase IV subunit A n=1 Tax=Inquilinus sp. Marseille-Q2685 TaxID=2866581 RepID=UPI001CE473B3|nr:DNA topoisomerase IV subunit A [Inquilinus sp. Marseille-Q2685]